MRRFIFLLAFLGLAQSVTAQDRTDDQIKSLALQAILENPQIIMEAVAILEAQEKERQALAAANVIGTMGEDPNAPVVGNENGDVTVIEFFDYNCPYCRRAGKALQDVLAQDSGIKVVMREWPILGEGSVIAARASLAARNQDKYQEFHWALMNSEGRADEAFVMNIARSVGLDTAQLRADMNSPAVEAHIAKSVELANALGFTGTPAFVVGDQAAPGFIPAEELTRLIAEARAN